MSFEIEFTGSLVDNRDLPQITTSSSLQKVQGVREDFNSTSFSFTNFMFGSLNSIPNGTANISYVDGSVVNGINPSSSVSGGEGVFTVGQINQGFFGANFLGWQMGARDTSLSGIAKNFEIRYKIELQGQSGNFTLDKYCSDNIGTEYIPLSGTSVPLNTYITESFSVSSSATSIGLGLYTNSSSISFIRLTVDYIYFSSSPVTVAITPSTQVNGAQKVGGTLATPTITEEVVGQPEISEPAELHGLVTKDGSSTVTKSTYLPAAADSVDSKKDIRSIKIFDAQTDTLTTEAVGLGASEIIDAGSSVIVEDIEVREEK